ncbi:DNA-binding transcriptional MerR regulator [Arthrobacter sp. 1088]|uniref:MerR family transcriptional regulator n=1 Tax=Arthrobacter sp. 1088 TaxID=2817768 RepID=UPI0028679A32|nr:MerR family transcriptional regulator [Arthrobacter sp. 1088]MDR6688664.1 DNA-binding transcriptional MerR regulator [Arthrobacter sp. 1088]
MRIGELAAKSGVSTRQLRYYEEQDLLHPIRSSNNYREFAPESLELVQQIRGLLDAGLPTRLIRILLPCVQGPDAELPAQVNGEMEQLLRGEISNLQARIEFLTHSREQIECYLGRVAHP